MRILSIGATVAALVVTLQTASAATPAGAPRQTDGADCPHERNYDGSLVSPEITDTFYAPSPDGFAFGGGVLAGHLTGHAEIDTVNLRLEERRRSGWETVEMSQNPKSKQDIRQKVRSGTYRWEVSLYSGRATFHLKTCHS